MIDVRCIFCRKSIRIDPASILAANPPCDRCAVESDRNMTNISEADLRRNRMLARHL